MSQPVFGKHSSQFAAHQFAQEISNQTNGLKLIAVYVDDQEDLLEIVGSNLEEFGFDTFTTTEPDAVIEFIKKHKNRIAFILSDYKMPKKNGFELKEAINEFAAEIPFAILSANIDKEMALKGMELKIATFIEKPFSKEHHFDFLVKEVNPRIASIHEERDLLKGFIEDSEILLENAEESFLYLSENGASAELLNQVFGMIHTIKGSSGFFEPRTLHKFAHKFEDTLKEAQSGDRPIDAALVSIWLKGIDVLKELISEFKSCQFEDRNLDELLKIFSKNELPDSGSKLTGDKEKISGGPAGTAIKKQEEVKISMSILDEFMQLSGEMTVVRNMITKAVRTIEKQYPADKDVLMLADLLNELHKINGMVQTKMTDIRKVPIKNVVKSLYRIVRDVAQSLNKEVEFKVEGEDLRIDNSIATVLSNSLIHLVRNSLDHGLEKTEDRLKAGKNKSGKVTIICKQDAEFVIISIKDDGKGINPDIVGKKALEKGIITAADLAKLSVAEKQGLIFAAGFSTADAITDISGRGVGMSMVKDSVEAVGGRIIIESEVGVGSTFKLRMPLPKSVLITNCLFVTLGNYQFGIPQDHIQRVLLVNESNRSSFITEVEGAQLLKLEGNLLPVIELHDVVEMGHLFERKNELTLVVLETSNGQFALGVDSVLDVEDTVIKHLTTEAIKKSKIFLGATFLGDGSVGMIFDVEGVARHMHVAIKSKNVKNDQNASLKESLEKTGELKKWLVAVAQTTKMATNESFREKYLIQQDDVFRIEELKKEDLQCAGDLWTIPYRGSVLTLVDFDRLMSQQDPFFINLSSDEKSDIQVIVLKLEGHYVGLKVTEVADLIECETSIEPLIKKNPLIAGALIYQQETLTVINQMALSEVLTHYKDPEKNEVQKQKGEAA